MLRWLSALVRLYLALVWWRFGVTKLRAGWLDGWLDGHPLAHPNPLRPLFELIAGGQLSTSLGLYRPVARLLLATHADAVLSAAMPLTEVTLAVALLVGRAPARWALAGLFLNANLWLSGVGSLQVDGPVILLELLLVAIVAVAHSSRVRSRGTSWPQLTRMSPWNGHERHRLSDLPAAGEHPPEPVIPRGLARPSGT